MADQSEVKRIHESLLVDLTGFPTRFQKAGQALTSAFKIPELSITMGQMDRRKLLETLVGLMGSREMLMNTYEGVRQNDIVQTILGVIKDDAFFTTEGAMFEIRYDEGNEEESDTQRKVNGYIKNFVVDCHVLALIENILDDWLLYGEYPLRVILSPNGEGVLAIKDDMDPISTVGIYEIDEPLFFLEKSSRGYTVRSPKEVVQFTVSPTKIRIKTLDNFNEKRQLPEYIRVGRSVIYPALQKIKQLQTIELASTLTDLKRAIAPILVSVAVPPGSQPEDVTEIVKKYEQHLQETYRGVPDLDNPSMGDLLSTVTNFRVIPNFTDGKGAITTLDILGNQQDTDSRIDRLRLAIAMAIGMPPYYLVTGQMDNGNQSKTEMLKLHSRYSRMISSIQLSLAAGIRRLVALHVINRGIYIDETLIKVRFKQVVNVEHLDQMEYMVASAQTLRDLWGVLSDILSSDEVKAELDSKRWIDMVNKYMMTSDLAAGPLLKFVEAPVEGVDGDASGMGGGGGGGGMGGSVGGGGDTGMGVEEAPMFDADGGGGGFEGDEMDNAAGIPPADFGPQDGGGGGGAAEEGPEGLPVEEAPLGDFGPEEGASPEEVAPEGGGGEVGGLEAEIEPPEMPAGSTLGAVAQNQKGPQNG